MPIVVGHAGVRVLPVERPREPTLFGFMSSTVSSEKPKSVSLKMWPKPIRATRAAGKKVLLVGGPAIVHTGSVPARRQADPRWLDPDGVRRQRPGHPRHRAGPLRHQPGRLARPRRADRARSRAPPAGDQPHPPGWAGIARAVESGRAHLGHHVRMRQDTRSISFWPGPSATTARCPR